MFAILREVLAYACFDDATRSLAEFPKLSAFMSTLEEKAKAWCVP